MRQLKLFLLSVLYGQTVAYLAETLAQYLKASLPEGRWEEGHAADETGLCWACRALEELEAEEVECALPGADRRVIHS